MILGVVLADIGTPRRDAAGRDGGCESGSRAAAPLIFLPLAIPIIIGGVGTSVTDDRPGTCGSFSTTHSLRSFAGLPLNMGYRSAPSRLRAAFTLVTVSVALASSTPVTRTA
jgi:hypothetical protein